jgi:hypothetical protein
MTIKKALRVFAFAVGYVLTYFFVLILLIYLADSVAVNFQLWYIDLVAIVFGNVLMIGLLLYFRHKTRSQWIRAEAKQWLAERSQPLVYARRRRLWRTVLWMPSVLVLVIFLFFPETAGLVSHLFCGPTVKLRQYRLKIPPTWIVATSNDSSAWIIAGKGIARVGFRPYWRGGRTNLGDVDVCSLGFPSAERMVLIARKNTFETDAKTRTRGPDMLGYRFVH